MLPFSALEDDISRAANVPLPCSPVLLKDQLTPPEDDGSNSLYPKYAQETDASVQSHWNADMDILLILVSLFMVLGCFEIVVELNPGRPVLCDCHNICRAVT